MSLHLLQYQQGIQIYSKTIIALSIQLFRGILHPNTVLIQQMSTLPNLPVIPMLQPLRPDRPAISYQISYSKYHEQKLSSKLSQNRTSQLLIQIQELKGCLNKERQYFKKQLDKKNQHILLMSIQVSRVRSIMIEQGEILQKTKNEWNNVQNVYNLKFEQIKMNMIEQFESQINSRKQQTKQQVEQIRQLYIQKIATISQQHQKQLSSKQKEYESLQQKLLSVNLFQLQKIQYENKLNKLNKQLQRLQSQIQAQKSQAYLLKQQKQKNEKYYLDKVHDLQLKYQQLHNINKHLNEEILRIKNQLLENDMEQKQEEKISEEKNKELSSNLNQLKYKCGLLETQNQELRRQNNSLENQISLTNNKSNMLQNELIISKSKCQVLERQLDQFKNRKTQQNPIANFNTQNLTTGKKFLMNQKNQYQNLKGLPKKYFEHQRQVEVSYGQVRLQTQQRHNIMVGGPSETPGGQRISYQRSLKRIQQLQAKIEDLEEQIQLKQRILDKKSEQINQQSKQISTLSKVISQKQLVLFQKQNVIQNLQSENQQLSNKIKLLEKQCSNSDKKLRQIEQKYQEKTKQLQKLQKTQKIIFEPNPFSAQQKLFSTDKLNEKQQKQLHNKLQQYERKIVHLESLVTALSDDWGQRQRNQNGIFRQIQNSYMDQIKMLKMKNQQNENLIKNMNDFIGDMATKNTTGNPKNTSKK